MGNDNNRLRAARVLGTHSRDEWAALCAEFGMRCVKCGLKPDKLTKDHIVPVAHGGSNAIDNIQPFCDPCNQDKGTASANYVSYRRHYGFGEHIPISQLEEAQP